MNKLILLFLLLSIQIGLSNYIVDIRTIVKTEKSESIIVFYFEYNRYI